MRQLISRATTLMLAAIFAVAPLATSAATTAVVSGVVRASSGAPLGGAQVELIGPTRLSKTTDAQGKFTFPAVPAGLYSLQVSKAGYTLYRDDSVAAFIGETVTANVTLAESSFSSLQTIAIGLDSQPRRRARSIRLPRQSVRLARKYSRIRALSRSRRCSMKRRASLSRRITPITAIRTTVPRRARSKRRRFAARCRTKPSRSSTVTPSRLVRRARSRRRSSTRFCSITSKSSKALARCRQRSTTRSTAR